MGRMVTVSASRESSVSTPMIEPSPLNSPSTTIWISNPKALTCSWGDGLCSLTQPHCDTSPACVRVGNEVIVQVPTDDGKATQPTTGQQKQQHRGLLLLRPSLYNRHPGRSRLNHALRAGKPPANGSDLGPIRRFLRYYGAGFLSNLSLLRTEYRKCWLRWWTPSSCPRSALRSWGC